MTKRCRICGDSMLMSDPHNVGLDECRSCRLRRSTGLLSMTDGALLEHINDLDAKLSKAQGIEATAFKAIISCVYGEINTRRVGRRHLGLPEGFDDC